MRTRQGFDADWRPATYWPSLPSDADLPELDDEDLAGGAVEIAGLYIASGIGNTISIRARADGSEITFAAVDEFGDNISFEPDRATHPLTYRELLEAVKTLEWLGPMTSGEVWWARELESDSDLEEEAEFITGDSDLYPLFDALIAEDNATWLAARHAEWGEEEEEETS